MTEAGSRLTGSYRLRLGVGYLLIVAVFAGAWAWSLFGPLTATVVERQEEHLQAVAQAGALVLGEADANVQEVADRLVARTELRLTVVASDGAVLADSEEDPATMENHGTRPEVLEAYEGNVGKDRRVSSTQDVEQIYVAVPASYEGERVVLRVSSPLDEVNAVAAQARRTGLILLALALLFAAVVVSRIVRFAARPVSELTYAAQAMAEGRLNTTIPEAPGELATLSDALENLRKQMRHRLDDLEAQKHNLQTVLDGLADAVFLLHGDRIQFANGAAGRLFRKPAAGWHNRPIDNAGLPASVQASVMEALGSDAPKVFECGPDTQGRYLRVLVTPLSPTNSEDRTIVSASDITERVRVDAVRRDFVANASHELKTPTSGISLLAESAADAAAHGDSDQAVEFARQIASESGRLSNLVRDLLDLSRLESAQEVTGTTDLRETIDNALVGHRAAAADAGLELSFEDKTPAVDAYAVADSTDAAVALDNLVDNAVKYTEAGEVTVTLSVDDEHVHVAVSDTGIGIPAEDLGRVFERFYRVDRARSRDSGGTGLGLSLVRHVVERSEGSVDVSSEPGQGTTFAISFRRASRRN